MSNQPPNSSKQEIRENTAERVRKYISEESRIKEILKQNPHHPEQEKEENRKAVLSQVQELEYFFASMFQHIKNIKTYITKVTDQNRITACYLLFGKITHSFDALFMLAKEGFSYEVMEINRGIRESLDLIHLFLYEDENSSNLKKWFSGQIVENSIARAAQDKFINQNPIDTDLQIPFKETLSHAYGLLSLYSHISYNALLDSFDVYNRDFDFQKISGFYYMRAETLPQVQQMLESTLLALKHFYSVIGDIKIYGELRTILERLSPHMRDLQFDQIKNEVF